LSSLASAMPGAAKAHALRVKSELTTDAAILDDYAVQEEAKRAVPAAVAYGPAARLLSFVALAVVAHWTKYSPWWLKYEVLAYYGSEQGRFTMSGWAVISQGLAISLAPVVIYNAYGALSSGDAPEISERWAAAAVLLPSSNGHWRSDEEHASRSLPALAALAQLLIVGGGLGAFVAGWGKWNPVATERAWRRYLNLDPEITTGRLLNQVWQRLIAWRQAPMEEDGDDDEVQRPFLAVLGHLLVADFIDHALEEAAPVATTTRRRRRRRSSRRRRRRRRGNDDDDDALEEVHTGDDAADAATIEVPPAPASLA